MNDLTLKDMEKMYDSANELLKEPITYKAKIVFYPSGESGLLPTIAETKRVFESGDYYLDFIMPFDEEPVIIITEKVSTRE